jgi:uncharacterized OB-fold protein/acyl dehydratase
MSLAADLQQYVGQQVGEPFVALDLVNEPMIRHWCDAIGDRNPVYTDAVAAKDTVHGGIIAPPTMLQAWTMNGLRPRTVVDPVMVALNDAGFTSVVATNCEQEYLRDLRPGDRLTVTSTIDSISDEKTTGLGVGHFLTTKMTFTDQDGEVVATMLFRILKFKPPVRPEPKPRRPRPALTRDNAWWFEALRAHQLLIQRCASCGVLRHPPRPMCDRCQSLEWDTVEASGRGEVYSFVVNHFPQVPAFDYPLTVGLIELAEGTRLVANVDPPVQIGMAVELYFVDHDEELTLPHFRAVG